MRRRWRGQRGSARVYLAVTFALVVGACVFLGFLFTSDSLLWRVIWFVDALLWICGATAWAVSYRREKEYERWHPSGSRRKEPSNR